MLQVMERWREVRSRGIQVNYLGNWQHMVTWSGFVQLILLSRGLSLQNLSG